MLKYSVMYKKKKKNSGPLCCLMEDLLLGSSKDAQFMYININDNSLSLQLHLKRLND